jgi:hypothetical protein
MTYDCMSGRCEQEYENPFEIVPIVRGNGTSEKRYKNAVGQTVSISCVLASMKLGDEIERSWKIREERVIRDQPAISGLVSR